MRGSLSAKAIYISFMEMGIKFIKITDDNPPTFYISVPNDGYVRPSDTKLFGEDLAKRFKSVFSDLIGKDCTVKYKIRNEYWSAYMAQQAREDAKNLVL